MGAMFIGQQFLQNVLGYSTLDAGLAILPAAFCMVIVAPRSAKLVEARGARFTLLFGYVFVLLGFLAMLLLWKEGIPYWKVGLGVRARRHRRRASPGRPASHSLTGSVPVRRAGMASGTADLQRDLGGAIMQSIFGALLTAGYAAAAGAAIAASPSASTSARASQSELTKSFASAEAVAQQYPQYAEPDHRRREDVVPAGRRLGVHGGDRRGPAGAVLVCLCFPTARSRARAAGVVPGERRRRRTTAGAGDHGRGRAGGRVSAAVSLPSAARRCGASRPRSRPRGRPALRAAPAGRARRAARASRAACARREARPRSAPT